MKSPHTLYLRVRHAALVSECPSFHRTGSIIGMRRKFYGTAAQLVRCGSYIYNVTGSPLLRSILNRAR